MHTRVNTELSHGSLHLSFCNEMAGRKGRRARRERERQLWEYRSYESGGSGNSFRRLLSRSGNRLEANRLRGAIPIFQNFSENARVQVGQQVRTDDRRKIFSAFIFHIGKRFGSLWFLERASGLFENESFCAPTGFRSSRRTALVDGRRVWQESCGPRSVK